MLRPFFCSGRLQFIAICLGLFLLAEPASATIIRGSVTGGDALTAGGTFIKLGSSLLHPLPGTVGDDNFQAPNLYGFDEDQNIVLTASLVVDVGSSPLSVGTLVASHYIFFDPKDGLRMTGTVTFDSAVLAVITSIIYLSASDYLAKTGVTYSNPNLRGLEGNDTVTFNGSQIQLSLAAWTPGDYFRVLTAPSPAAVPEPTTMLLLGTGLAGLAATRRKKKALV